jgi:hypothetical protein
VSAHVRWSKGGEATILSLDGDRVAVRSSTPSAPGSRPEGTLASGARFWIKVARCRKDEDGFLLEGRLLDATRDARSELQLLLQLQTGKPGT